MQHISWDKVFAGEVPGKGATEAEVRHFIAALAKAVSEEEVQMINESQDSSGPVDPRHWQLPSKALPPSYLSFLHWSNGGSFYNGHRGFNFLSTSTLRQFALSYHFPQFMPGALPFAFDGDDNFYLFDMRSDPVKGEYPILFVRGENQGYANAVHVADSFTEACQGQADPVALLKD
jgi:hypothetical protein